MKKNTLILKVSHEEAHATTSLASQLQALLTAVPRYREIIIVCIGTDRSTGDALGPLVGTHLARLHSSLQIYGTLEEPVHAMNLQTSMDHISNQHQNPYIIAIDACLGQSSSVGTIQLSNGPVKPGAGVNKDLPPVGDIHITGIVNVGGFMEYFVLQNTRLSLVFQMSEVIANAIHRTASLLLPHMNTTSLVKQE